MSTLDDCSTSSPLLPRANRHREGSPPHSQTRRLASLCSLLFLRPASPQLSGTSPTFPIQPVQGSTRWSTMKNPRVGFLRVFLVSPIRRAPESPSKACREGGAERRPFRPALPSPFLTQPPAPRRGRAPSASFAAAAAAAPSSPAAAAATAARMAAPGGGAAGGAGGERGRAGLCAARGRSEALFTRIQREEPLGEPGLFSLGKRRLGGDLSDLSK